MPECLSHHDLHLQRGAARVVQHAQFKLRDIDDDRRAGEAVREPSPALKSQLDLPGPLAKRNIQRAESRGAGYTIRVEPMSRLEVFHAFDHRARVSRLAGCGVVPQISQPLKQGLEACEIGV